MAKQETAEVHKPRGIVTTGPSGKLNAFLVSSIPVCALLVFIVGAGVVGWVFYIVSQIDSPPPLAAVPKKDTDSGEKRDENTVDGAVLRATYNLAQKQLAVRAVQLAAGYGVGFLCVSCGIILAWCGVSGQVEFTIGDEKRNLSLNTANIGAAIVFFGVLLISISMWCRPIKVESSGGLKLESPFAGGAGSNNQTTFEF